MLIFTNCFHSLALSGYCVHSYLFLTAFEVQRPLPYRYNLVYWAEVEANLQHAYLNISEFVLSYGAQSPDKMQFIWEGLFYVLHFFCVCACARAYVCLRAHTHIHACTHTSEQWRTLAVLNQHDFCGIASCLRGKKRMNPFPKQSIVMDMSGVKDG